MESMALTSPFPGVAVRRGCGKEMSQDRFSRVHIQWIDKVVLQRVPRSCLKMSLLPPCLKLTEFIES